MMNGNRFPVLMYHNIHPDTSIISISPETFSHQIEWLYKQGYKALGLSFLIDHMRNGKEIPDNSIFLTFDDGYAGLHKYVFPKLLRYGFSSTIFLVSGYCGQNNDWPGQLSNIPRMPLLSWDQIQEMDEHGIEFGAHTASHPKLDELKPDEIKEEIRGSKELIEKRLGHKITSFAYPYGRFNGTVKGIVEGEFLGACSTIVGFVNPSSDPYVIERIDINLTKELWMFRGLKSAAFPYYLALRNSLRSISKSIFNRPWW
jgi:peptidoglycan/xylan/chitin deacetylase (PgdA/CDA1 family)